MDPLSIGLGLGSTLLPSILDEITGASRARKKAIEERDRQLMQFLDEIEAEAGPDVTGSLFFRTGEGLLNRERDRLERADTQTAAAEGASEETKLARMQSRNEGYSGSLLNLLRGAQAERQRLKQLKRSLQLQRLGLTVGEAEQDVARLGQLSQGITSVAPYLFGRGDEPAPAISGLATSNTTIPTYRKRKSPSILGGFYEFQ